MNQIGSWETLGEQLAEVHKCMVIDRAIHASTWRDLEATSAG